MSRTTIIRALDCIAIFLAAHLAFYGFTGLALWGVGCRPDQQQHPHL